MYLKQGGAAWEACSSNSEFWEPSRHSLIDKTQRNQAKPVPRWPVAGPSGYWPVASSLALKWMGHQNKFEFYGKFCRCSYTDTSYNTLRIKQHHDQHTAPTHVTKPTHTHAYPHPHIFTNPTHTLTHTFQTKMGTWFLFWGKWPGN